MPGELAIDGEICVEDVLGWTARLGAPCLEFDLNSFHRPNLDEIGSVVEHLPHHLTAELGIRGDLRLDECRHSVLIEVEVIKAPSMAFVSIVRNSGRSRLLGLFINRTNDG